MARSFTREAELYKKLILTIAVCLTFSVMLRAQQPQPVTLSMIVTDNKNKSVNSIRKDQVHVFEGKVEQTLLSIEPDERPIDYGILIDASGSFRRWINPALDVLTLIIKNRRPSDEIFIERFVSSDKIENYREFTTDSAALIKSLDGFYVESGQSAVVDALYMGVVHVDEHNKSNDGRRKAVVILTDGEDRNSFYKQETLIQLLRETGVQVFVLGLVDDLSNQSPYSKPGARDRAEKLLRTVANESGGRVFFPRDREELVNAATEIIMDLRGQFRIRYQSTNVAQNGFHEVDVKFASTDGEKRRLFVPSGYFVGPRTPEKQEKKP
ncbi:MAG TPA: VWA domain-containing protein [Pyrinomonadaceae bacterium]|nr:VWA domain-containing protein [Pyrinomonadaceae bacterium]